MLAERVIKAITKVKGERTITVDSTFAELGIDSLDAIEVLFEVEEEFNLSIPNEALRGMTCVRDVVQGVERLLKGEPLPGTGPAPNGTAERGTGA
jgi:acyl carrier protein